MALFLMLATTPKRKSWPMNRSGIPGGERGTASMTNERSLVAPRARALRSITALTIISSSLGVGWPRANRSETKLMNVPLSFEPNQGQAPSTVEFLSRGSGYALFLTPGKVVLNLERQQPEAADTLRMS